MHIFTYTILQFAVFVLTLNSLECAKILAVFPFSGRSQYMCVHTYLKELAERGHEITAVSLYPQKKGLKNFREIALKNDFKDHSEFVLHTIDLMARSKLSEMYNVWEYSLMASTAALENQEFQQLLRSQAHFDLIIVEVLSLESLYALGQHFKAPMIGVSTFGTDVNIDQLVDNTSPVAYVPTPSSRHVDGMNFWQRLHNLYAFTVELLYHHFVIIPAQQRNYEKYFPNATLSLSEVRRDFSLLLLNQHYSLSWPRPYVPNAIEVAGMHIKRKVDKLPADMETFINSSPNGTCIYFALGSNVESALFPKEQLATIMDVFASLPVNVLFKFEKANLPGKPKNVYISKWFPQTDILAHPKVKLFITHGGMHSYIETVHFGKPIVGMPAYFDQYLNVARAIAKGLGLQVSYKDFSAEDLRSAILEVLNNPKFAEKAKVISERYHDRPMNGIDTAIYWTEYVLRHKGAPHLRVAARQLNFWQRNSLDTMAVLFGLPLLIVIFIVLIICKVFKSICFGRMKDSTIKRVTKRKGE